MREKGDKSVAIQGEGRTVDELGLARSVRASGKSRRGVHVGARGRGKTSQ